MYFIIKRRDSEKVRCISTEDFVLEPYTDGTMMVELKSTNYYFRCHSANLPALLQSGMITVYSSVSELPEDVSTAPWFCFEGIKYIMDHAGSNAIDTLCNLAPTTFFRALMDASTSSYNFDVFKKSFTQENTENVLTHGMGSTFTLLAQEFERVHSLSAGFK